MAKIFLLLLGCAAFAASAAAAPPPTLGAGPHYDRSETRGGEGHWRGDVPAAPKVPVAPKAGSSTGASAPPATPAGDEEERARKEDERRATRRMDEMKRRPGFQKEAPQPRADVPAARTTN